MTKRLVLVLPIVALALLVAVPAWPCTTVCLLGGGKAVVAYNYDFDPSDGLVLVNKRGMAKRSSQRTQGATWTAAYGSVTFNQFGRDHPTTGINEQGLMVSLMWLDGTKYPPADDRPAIGILEWIQYHLDRHASVAEVLAHADAVRPTSTIPIHYLFADATGDVAAVEFLGGKLVAHRGEAMPVRALANSTYRDSLAALDTARKRGAVPASTSSLDRFARAAMLAGREAADPIAHGFEILASVAQPGYTRWSIVYDLGAREVHFRTDGNGAIRRIALSRFDFSCGAPVTMLDVTAAGAGDVAGAFVDYTTAANRELIEASFTKTPFLRAIPAAVRDRAAAHPERTSSCAQSPSIGTGSTGSASGNPKTRE